LIVL
jgi:ABC-type multidrug transport system fused ATPase/permease subunit